MFEELMRVDFTTFASEPLQNSNLGHARHAETSGIAATSTPGPDRIRFLFDRTRMQSLAAHVLAQPDIRETKVRSLRQAIGNGEYSVPAGQVADALVSDLGVGSQS
jgi:flagellar biosynthesis anti-sigma factor FlgM